MQMEHTFTVPVPVREAWHVLLDAERIAPCMPGAALDSVNGDEFAGRVKVKVGPVSLTYKGLARIVSKDEAAFTAVIVAKGKDSRGNGTAAARVTMSLVEEARATRVNLLTDLDLTGRPAQMGRGVMVDVGDRIIGQFADSLADQIRHGGSAAEPAAEPVAAASPEPSRGAEQNRDPAREQRPEQQPDRQRRPAAREPEAINVIGLAGRSALKVYAGAVLRFLKRLVGRR